MPCNGLAQTTLCLYQARAPYLRQLLLRLDFNGWVQADATHHRTQQEGL